MMISANDVSFDIRGLGLHLNTHSSPQPPLPFESQKTVKISRQQRSPPSAPVQALQQNPAAECECRGEYSGLGRWILAKELGNGTFGKVYHAKDSRGQMQDVAIKIIFKSKDLNQVCMDGLYHSRRYPIINDCYNAGSGHSTGSASYA